LLIVGGTSAGMAVASSDLHAVAGNFLFDRLTSPRAATRRSRQQQDGLLLIAGGKVRIEFARSTEVTRIRHRKTDASDHAPGSIVTITVPAGSRAKPLP
jgi:hypothetical protein